MHAVCVVATSLERGLPVGFVESAAPPPRSDREIHYVHTRLEGQHVRASARDPAALPAGRGDRAAGRRRATTSTARRG